jgi:hypothetical protein
VNTALTALLVRDLRLATRAGGGALMGVLFFLAVVTLAPFALGPDLEGFAAFESVERGHGGSFVSGKRIPQGTAVRQQSRPQDKGKRQS